MASAPAATYTIFVYNDGPDDESLSFEVVLSASLAAASVPETRSGWPFRPDARPKGQIRIP